jgi:glycosyltransferase involved in cell wall biosynthesis
MPRLTVILPTGNVLSQSPGEAVFRRVLAALAWADEIVIVDSDSSDGTREVAAEFTPHIFVHPYRGSLKQQKKIALEHASGDWILWVDADEVLPPALAAEIRAAVAAPTARGWRIRRQHVFAGRVLRHAGEDAPLRLWRRGDGHWDGTENDEFYVVDPPVATFPTPQEHYSTARLADRLRKIAYFAPAHAALLPLPPRADYTRRDLWRRLLRPAVQRFYGVWWVERGRKDGVRGLLWALLCAINEFYVYMLLWERAQTTPEAARTGQSAG